MPPDLTLGMNRTHSITQFAACLFALAALAPAGQSPLDAPPGGSPPGDGMKQMDAPTMQPPGLGGPTVPESAARTLVHYNARGEFQRLDTLPEIAALDLLQLEPERRQASWSIIESFRSSMIDLLVDQIDLLRDATDAQRDGDNEKVQQLYRDMYDVFNPTHERDPLAGELSELLTAEEQTAFRSHLDEYWTALVAWELRRGRDVTDQQRAETLQRLVFNNFQQLLARAYQTSLRPYQARLETIYSLTEPTDDQRARLRETLIEFIRETRLTPTPEQRENLVRRIYETLDDEQRIKVMSYALSRL